MGKDWKNKNNHKGFDVAANRVSEYVDDYLTKNIEKETKKNML